MIDLVIRGGQIIDGSGREASAGDVAIDAGRIVEVGSRSTLSARREISADGAYVTPGFVDIHTHYDAQVLWDPLVNPSSEHGVTSVVIGNCGLGLAPVRPPDRKAVQRLLGGVEDIPQATLEQGIRWSWEDYPEYLKALASSPRSVEVGALIGHAALRVYAMGAERAYRDAARPDEIAQMADQLRQALAAGALGLSTSRSRLDRDCDGRSTPSCFALDEELYALADVLRAEDRGVIGLAFRGCGLICDASVPTFLLTHWSRDRRRGPRFPLEWIVHKQTAETAALFGLNDRGLLRSGLRADVNVIDFSRLQLEPPRVEHDLPAAGRRLVQGARGYVATLVAGQITREDGRDTGARPGGLARTHTR